MCAFISWTLELLKWYITCSPKENIYIVAYGFSGSIPISLIKHSTCKKYIIQHCVLRQSIYISMDIGYIELAPQREKFPRVHCLLIC